jgi:hypothetical protein
MENVERDSQTYAIIGAAMEALDQGFSKRFIRRHEQLSWLKKGFRFKKKFRLE